MTTDRHSKSIQDAPSLLCTQDVAGSNPVTSKNLNPAKSKTDNSLRQCSDQSLNLRVSDKLQQKVKHFSQSSTQVQHFNVQHSLDFLSVTEASEKLNVSVMTITRWCQSGKLPAIEKPYGNKTTYLIRPLALEMLLQANKIKAEKHVQQKAKPLLKNHAGFIPAWLQAMGNGLINGKPFSKRTIDDYRYYVTLYFKKHSSVSLEGFKKELALIPVAQVSKRQHYFKAMVCLGKYLIKENALAEDFLKDVLPFFPKRHLPPKRNTIDEAEFRQLLHHVANEMEYLLVVLLASTGIRATECCQLERSDLDLENQSLTIRLGKGNKTRTVGLSQEVVKAFQAYVAVAPVKHGLIFRDRFGQPLTRSGLYQRIERIGQHAKIKVHPHALRRAFVTINANKGRPLVILQRSCGHSDIKTTMSYCLTSEQEVINAMKEWD